MKKGKLSVEYIAIIVLIIAVVLIMLIFSDHIRQGILDSFQGFVEVIR